MTFFQWRRFNFFDLVRDTDKGALEQSFKDVSITCCTSARGHLTLGDNLGLIHLFDRQYKLESFKGYNINTSQIVALKQSAFLATVGEDEPGINPFIKIWNMEKKDVHGNPVCVHMVRALPGNRPVPVTAFAIDEQMHLMVAGFADGSIILYRGDLSRGRHSKQKLLQPGLGSVTGLSLRTVQKVSHLFVAASGGIVCYTIPSKDKELLTVLDSVGCSPCCHVLADSKQDQHFMVARNDAVYCYTPEGRGPCYAFEGEKMAMHWFRGYLLIVSKLAAKGNTMNSDKLVLTIFDVHNKFIAFTGPLTEAQYVLSEWGSVLVVTSDRKIHQLIEKDLHSKLDILFKKNLYDVAIRVAKSQQYDVEGLVEIFRHYGDHLYAKGNHSGAMEQYLKTIGRLEPSYVIKRFLDAQRINQLTAYLQELHKQGLASEDHTTLLLNCYTKLKDTERLDQFLNAKDQRSEFDAETAIRVCRQAGYFSQALRLAQDRQKHDWYLKILLEDTCDYGRALQYIRTLPVQQAKENLQEHGSFLLEQLPDETTRLLLELCTRETAEDEDGCDPKDFLLLFINHNEKLGEFLEHVVGRARGEALQSLHFALLEQYLLQWSKRIADTELEAKMTQLLQHGSVLSAADRALFLCQTHKFRAGVLLVLEKTKLYGEIVQFYTAEDDLERVIGTCRRFGGQEPSLWVQALTAATAAGRRASHESLAEILTAVEKNQLLPPLRVIEILCRSADATLGLARDYLIRTLQADQSSISEDERLIQRYRQETSAVRQQIDQIKTGALVFQGSKCSVCNQPLDLPSIHFLCLHSFHQHCFDSYADNEHECPVCHVENKRILDIVRAQEQSKDLHEAFHGQLEKADDPFTVLADYFGRGVFNALPTWESTVSASTVRKDRYPVAAATTWGPANAGPGSEAKIRRNEGRSSATSTVFNNEGRVRAEERPSARPTAVSEGRLRHAEPQAASEKASASAAVGSEGRHRLQEGGRSAAAAAGAAVAAASSKGSIPATTAASSTTLTSEARQRLQEGNRSGGRAISIPAPATVRVSSVASSEPSSFLRPRDGGSSATRLAPGAAAKTHVRNSSDGSRRPAASSASQTACIGANPFGDDDDHGNGAGDGDSDATGYDEAKNPFTEDEPVVKDQPINPFGEEDDADYNDSLNPFAE